MSRERKIRIRVKDVELVASLNDSSTANAVWDALPIIGHAQTGGEEIYFSVPIKVRGRSERRRDCRERCGGILAARQRILFVLRPTPVSQADEIRPASAVNVVGKIDNAASALAKINNGSKVEVILE